MQWILEERESVCDKGIALNKSTTLHWMSPHPVAGVCGHHKLETMG